MSEVPGLILASASPRRAMLLEQMGFKFRIIPAEADESWPEKSSPESGAMEISARKARAVYKLYKNGIIIGADTIVVLDEMILGKPADAVDARHMLKSLSGRTHSVYTGFTLIHSGNEVSDFEQTDVTFRRIEEWEIEDYVESGAALDKAGAYGIQDRSGLFVDTINGCFYNVVGFPLTKFYQSLAELIGIEKLRHMTKDQDE